MSNELMQTMYEEGRTLAEIAEAMECSPSEVTALLGKHDGDADAMTVREQKYARQLRRVRSLADAITLGYLERLQAVIADTESTDDEKAAAFSEMDKVLRVAKLYSDRVLLAEGRTTENIGVNGNAMPFNVMFTKTYELPDGTTEDAEDTE
jgi:hypothetical protein